MFDEFKKTPTITDGPLEGKGTYRFYHMYFHWLTKTPDEWGFNNVSFPAELHLVFYNIKYGSYDKAMEKHEGIAALSISFRVRDVSSPAMIFIKDKLLPIRMPYTNAIITKFNSLSLFSYLPNFWYYYFTYSGAMVFEASKNGTHCKESVIWIDFEESFKISPEQVMEFNKLFAFNGFPLVDNTVNYTKPKSQIYSSLNPYGPQIMLNKAWKQSMEYILLLGTFISILILQDFA
uniref:carbonic anhydrase n=1 Tax=Stomoxys calcitrans TaxID=35570 RepID=A0A1I8PIL8_STOCA